MKSKNIRAIIFVLGGAATILIGAAVGWCAMRPMTICLTFDDGLKAHATVAGPLLRKYGWFGAFAIVTEENHSLHPVFSRYAMATAAEIKSLHAAGHSIFPHTVTHPNLKSLAESGHHQAMVEEIVKSRQAVLRITGESPPFFVLPYNALNDEVAAVIQSNQMIPVDWGRTDFGYHGTKYQTEEFVSDYLEAIYKGGAWHEDIMIHGIRISEGGWRAFEDDHDFEQFLLAIKSLEAAGKIRVVPFAAAHSTGTFGRAVIRMLAFVRRQIYKRLIY